MAKYQNKYRGQSHRRPNWDYSAEALYFLTIVTQHRVCNLGTIVNNKLELSDFGKIVEIEWFKSFEIRQELLLHAFVLMPNHLHTIVEIREKWDGKDDGSGVNVADGGELAHGRVDGHGRADLHGRLSQPMNSIISPDSINPADPSDPSDNFDTGSLSIKRNPPVRQPKSISSFMAGYKSAINTKIDDYIDEHQLPIPKYNKNNHFFQPNYHDHIVRNHPEYLRIKKYIDNNPFNWGKDKLKG